ncbi:MAG: hypothetical protein IPG17_12230 [Sandaracinaceae bacterium]|nr:hypothetical protein [Sandaracinaceae bacterium]
MGLLDIFAKNDSPAAIKKHAARVGNKRSQAQDRWDSIKALRKAGGVLAAEGLLPRFDYKVDPSISDREEKDYVVECLVHIGEAGLPAVRAFLQSSDSIAWPLRVLTQLLDEQAVIAELLALLGEMSAEYERFPEKKIQVLAELEERRDPRIAEAVLPFIRDMNETARLHAMGALLRQADAAPFVDAVVDAFLEEESARIRATVLDRLAAASLPVGARQAEVAARMPSGYKLDAGGVPQRS